MTLIRRMRSDRELIVLAHDHDRVAAAFAESRSASGSATSLVTPRDVSSPGWTLEVGEPQAATLAANGRVLAAHDLLGIITRLSWVHPGDLPHVRPEDRNYVASEVAAFLVAWLSAVTCPVVNRPSARALCGPGWVRSRWRHEAAVAGFGVRGGANCADASLETCLVVGDQVIGSCSEKRRASALALANSAGVTFLSILHDRGRFHSAAALPTLQPDALDPLYQALDSQR